MKNFGSLYFLGLTCCYYFIFCYIFTVHCHVGSLENYQSIIRVGDRVHCHVGSLEMLEQCSQL